MVLLTWIVSLFIEGDNCEGFPKEWGESGSCPTHKEFSNLYSLIPMLEKVTFFPMVLTLVSSTFSFPLWELESLLDNFGTIVEGDYVMVRGLGMTLANSLTGNFFVGAPSNLLQKEK